MGIAVLLLAWNTGRVGTQSYDLERWGAKFGTFETGVQRLGEMGGFGWGLGPVGISREVTSWQ